MSTELIQEYRGNVIENIHNGRICIVNEFGEVIYKFGDIDQLTFFRSCAKPLQVLPILVRKLHEKYKLSEEEISIMAGSHTGEKIHISILEGMLKKTQIEEKDLIINACYPDNKAHRKELEINNMPKRKIYHNCAGKHIGLMLLARELGSDIQDYWKPHNIVQQEVIKYICYLTGCREEQIEIGIDGCGVPVFAVPMDGIAKSYMQLAYPEAIKDEHIRIAATTIRNLIQKNPYMIRGHGCLCSEINLNENIIAKDGAKGVYGVGLKKERLGIAVKIEDGTSQTWALVIKGILQQIGYKDNELFELLEENCPEYIMNDTNKMIGRYEIKFRLKNTKIVI